MMAHEMLKANVLWRVVSCVALNWRSI